MNKLDRWDRATLESIVMASTTVAECLRKLGLCTRGQNFNTFRKKVTEFAIDVSHFDTLASERSRKAGEFRNKWMDADIFVNNSPVSLKCLRTRYRKLVPSVRCVLCGIGESYNNRPLVLQLDHINGIRNDNRIENLRWLCPNCHSQTDTFCTRSPT